MGEETTTWATDINSRFYLFADCGMSQSALRPALKRDLFARVSLDFCADKRYFCFFWGDC